MHLYFYAPDTTRRDLQDAYRQIKEILDRTDVWVSTNTEDNPVQVSAEVLAEAKQTGVPLLERMDAFIIEGTVSDPEVGFLLAHAVALKKPTLYLYRRGTVPQIFSHLSQKELPPMIRPTAYEAKNLERVVTEFFQRTTGAKIKQVPRHKFTLRITDAIEEYLNFKTHNTKLTKADHLRDQIEKWMERDEEWLKYQRRRRT